MNSSLRGSRAGDGREGPFVMHLERLCQLIAMGQTFTVEFHPVSDLPLSLRGKVVKRLGLHILDGGDVAIQLLDDSTSIMVGLSLANYKALWRVWQAGTPSDALRRGTPWRGRS